MKSEHERHKQYYEQFDKAKQGRLEGQYYWSVVKYVTDRNISPLDPDDLELFQDAIFESPWGRIHIHFYEWMFDKYYKVYPECFLVIFSKYLNYLDKVSPLFTADAFSFVFRKKNIKLVEGLLKVLSFDLKMKFIKTSEKHPDMIQLVPKLKLYNLFS